MICNKCGAQCDDNQAFCLKCGNPIQLTADFNLIEKELASNIDELMNEIEENGESIPEEDDELKTIDVPLEEINMGLKVVDINRNSSSGELYDEEDITPVYVPGERNANRETQHKKTATSKKKDKKSNKKLYGIIAGAVVLVAVIVVAVFMLLDDGDSDVKGAKTFNDYYSSAETAFNSGNIDMSLEEAYEALAVVANDADEIKVRKLIYKIYNQQNFSGATYLDNIEKLIALGDTSEDYYGIIVGKYIENKNTEMLIELIAKVGEDKAKEYFGESFVEKPVSNEETGEYKNYVSIQLTAAEGCKVYYAVNDDITKNAIEYTGEVALLEVGDFVVTAYAVSETGIPSSIAEYTYTIVEGEAEGPAVTPSEGTYSEPAQITVEVPEGGKAYYTYGKDAEKPNESSTEYTEPVDMLRGINKFRVIVVDKYGNVSEVTTMQYNLKLERKETITSGEEKVIAYYYNSGKIDPEGNMADGSVLEISYENAAVIENDEYYIYSAVATILEGETLTTKGITYVGVNTYDGTVVEGLIQAGDEYILPEIKK